MKLWTIQPVEIVDVLKHEGVFRCDVNLSENYEDFHEAYTWIVKEMDKRKIYHPAGLELPLWAWHTRNWKHKKPDFRTTGLGCPGERYACIEFEISDEDVLLSDYNNWHYVLNRGWFDDSKNEEEWEKLQEWFDTLPPNEREKLRVESWQKIFDVEPYEDEWSSKGSYIQATFWELRKEMVKDIKYFKSR